MLTKLLISVSLLAMGGCVYQPKPVPVVRYQAPKPVVAKKAAPAPRRMAVVREGSGASSSGASAPSAPSGPTGPTGPGAGDDGADGSDGSDGGGGWDGG